MRKIRNPFIDLEGYNCFGCSPNNMSGLRLTFFEEGGELTSTWMPQQHLEGYHNVLHGGIQATLMDEIASWVVYVILKTSGVTSSMNIRYLKPVSVKEPLLKLIAKVKERRRNLADIEVRLFDSSGILCAEALVTYFTFSEQKSKESLYYPDHEAFLKNKSGRNVQPSLIYRWLISF